MGTSVAIIGAGRVGTALGVLLSQEGYRLTGVADIDLVHAEACARLILSEASEQDLAGFVSTGPCQFVGDADIVFITTPDREIPHVARLLAECARGKEQPLRAGATLCHTSGALPSTILKVEGLEHVSVLSLHPLQTFPDRETAPRLLAGAIFVLEGDPDAVAVGERLVQDLAGRAVTIEARHKTIYHAAACTASNYLVTLLHLAGRLLSRAGVDWDDALDMLLPLARTTLDNVASLGTHSALTGPIERGDIATLESHLGALRRGPDPDLQAVYAILGLSAAALASEKGSISPEQRGRIEELLSAALSTSLRATGRGTSGKGGPPPSDAAEPRDPTSEREE